jgi:hypothetical protein
MAITKPREKPARQAFAGRAPDPNRPPSGVMRSGKKGRGGFGNGVLGRRTPSLIAAGSGRPEGVLGLDLVADGGLRGAAHIVERDARAAPWPR